MRMHRLEIEGFGPFLRRQVVDFDAFAADGIFVISGRTGAGKSSILDAVCFALYGSVPRYDSGEKRLRSDHCAIDDPTLVALEFSAGGDRWRVERSPEYERAKRNGTGTTTAPPQARLLVRRGEDWEGRAARPRDVGEVLHEILPLTQEQFLQVILLAQNRFARFLLASQGERQALLRTLFGTRRFEQYEHALEQRRKNSEGRVALGRDALGQRLEEAETLVVLHGLDDEETGHAGTTGTAEVGTTGTADIGASSTAERIERLKQATQRAAYRAETAGLAHDEARAARDAADEALADVIARRELQERRDRARARLASLEAETARIDQARGERDAALRAERAREGIRGFETARSAAAQAEEERDRAQAAWAALAATASFGVDVALEDGAPRLEPDDLADVIDVITQAIGGWQPLLDRENTIAARRAEHDASRAELAALDDAVAAVLAERQSASARRDEIDRELVSLAPVLAGGAAAAARCTEVDARIAAAEEAENLIAEGAVAQRNALEADRALVEASAAVLELRERRLRGHAGELADALVSGEPCPVCGGVEHPSPAPRGDDPVAAGDIEAAERRLSAAVSAQRDASEQHARLRQAAAGALGRAGDRSREDLRSERDAAFAALARAVAAEQRTGELQAERAESLATLADLEVAHAAATAHRETLDRAILVIETGITSDELALTRARGSYATIAERIAGARAVASAAQDLRDAIKTAERCRNDERDARARLEHDLVAAGFETADAARTALRDIAARTRLDETILRYDVAFAGAKAVLLDLELQALPQEPIDTTVAAAARDAARESWTAAVQRTLLAEQTHDRLMILVEQSAAAQSGITAAIADHQAIERLAHTVAGKAPNTHRMKLETFVLAAELEEIVEAANLRLDDMSAGRYRLLHTDALAARGAASGLGLEVLDAYTGRSRPAQSLSGGETFLASLALALGLAEVVTGRAGGITLDTLFIDEGFGSLDAGTLDTAMRTLDELRQGGRTVGVISHVESMKDQIPAQLLVTVADDGASDVAAHAFLSG